MRAIRLAVACPVARATAFPIAFIALMMALASAVAADPIGAEGLPDDLPVEMGGPIGDVIDDADDPTGGIGPGGGGFGPFQFAGPSGDVAPVENAEGMEAEQVVEAADVQSPPLPAVAPEEEAPDEPLIQANDGIIAEIPPPQAPAATAGFGGWDVNQPSVDADVPTEDSLPAPPPIPGAANPSEPKRPAADEADRTGPVLAAAVGVGLVAIGAVTWGWVLRGAASLFSHVTADRALSQPTRDRLLGHLRANPGQSLPEIQQALGLTRNNASYHLAVLHALGFVQPANVGRHRYFFPSEGAGASERLAALRNGRRRAIAEHIAAHAGCTQNEVSNALGLAPSRVHAHVGRLVEVGLIEREVEGRVVRLRPTLEMEFSSLTLAPVSPGASNAMA